jgi:hypothetical protein
MRRRVAKQRMRRMEHRPDWWRDVPLLFKRCVSSSFRSKWSFMTVEIDTNLLSLRQTTRSFGKMHLEGSQRYGPLDYLALSVAKHLLLC